MKLAAAVAAVLLSKFDSTLYNFILVRPARFVSFRSWPPPRQGACVGLYTGRHYRSKILGNQRLGGQPALVLSYYCRILPIRLYFTIPYIFFFLHLAITYQTLLYMTLLYPAMPP